MFEPPQIARTTAQATANLHLRIPRREIQNAMGPGLQEVKAALAVQGVEAAGPWFTHHLRTDPEVFDFEISMPVVAPVAAAGRVKPGQWPAMEVVRTIFHGGYEGLGSAWQAFDAWIAAHGHRTGPDLWERYLSGPESGPDPATWRTELIRRLKG